MSNATGKTLVSRNSTALVSNRLGSYSTRENADTAIARLSPAAREVQVVVTHVPARLYAGRLIPARDYFAVSFMLPSGAPIWR